MRKKYSFCEKYSKKIEQYLIDCEIKYRIIGDNYLISKMISFVVYDDKLNQLDHIVHGLPIVTNEFTRKELQNAEYLTIRPKKNIVDIINVRDAFVFKCHKKSITGTTKYEHKEQIGNLIVKQINTNEATCFFSSTTGFSEIYIKNDMCDVIQQEGIKGITFRPVKTEKYGKRIDSGLYQMLSDIIIKNEAILFDNNQKLIKCPTCGSQKVICNQDYQLQLDESLIDLSNDFYMTEAIFGEGISYPLFIVSHKFYNVIMKNSMASHVVFEPVLLSNSNHGLH